MDRKDLKLRLMLELSKRNIDFNNFESMSVLPKEEIDRVVNSEMMKEEKV